MIKIKKCIIIPDSFKGTLSSSKVCELGENAVNKIFPSCEVLKVPIADGGEGTVDCFLQILKGKKINLTVNGPYLEKVEAYYGLFGDFAVVEMAQAAGLPMVNDKKNPAETTTFGVGEMILDAVRRGAKKIYLGLGGSCTNDGGCGCASALGGKFLDEEGNDFVPVGGTLKNIHGIDISGLRKNLEGCEIIAMCDVDNPMFGENGAAYIYGPQKGADEDMVRELDAQLKYLDKIVTDSLKIDSVAEISGAGAAGAFGVGVIMFLKGILRPGIEIILDLIDFDTLLETADMVFTGEGQIDHQSIQGKVVAGISKRCKVKNVPVCVVAGSIGNGADKAYELGVSAIFSINRRAEDFEISKYKSEENFKNTFEDVLRLIKASEKMGCV